MLATLRRRLNQIGSNALVSLDSEHIGTPRPEVCSLYGCSSLYVAGFAVAGDPCILVEWKTAASGVALPFH